MDIQKELIAEYDRELDIDAKNAGFDSRRCRFELEG